MRRIFGRLGWRVRSHSVSCDSGGEFVGSALAESLASLDVELLAVPPGLSVGYWVRAIIP